MHSTVCRLRCPARLPGIHHLPKTPLNHEPMTDAMQACIDACHECHNTCAETVHHCLSLGGKHASPEHITLMLDCVAICATSAAFMARQSTRHGMVCRVCVDVCTACADDCERVGPDDRMMQRCAEVCRECAESCRAMAA